MSTYVAALGYQEVVHEPMVCDRIKKPPALIADLGIREVWNSQA